MKASYVVGTLLLVCSTAWSATASEAPAWEVTCRRVLSSPPLANVGGGLLYELKLGDSVEWSTLVPSSDIVDCAVLSSIAKREAEPTGVFLAFPLVQGGLRVCAFELQHDIPSGGWEQARLCLDIGDRLAKACAYSSVQGNFEGGEVSIELGAEGRSECEVIARSPFRP